MVRPKQSWHFRLDDIMDYDPYTVYVGFLNIFSLKVPHGGKFTSRPNRKYVSGKVKFVDMIDSKELTIEVLHKIVKMLKYPAKQIMFYQFKIPAENCSRSHFSGRANCDLLINNICEVFNRQLLEARNSPIISALEYTKEYLMKKIVKGPLGDQCVVNLTERNCSCRKWEVSGIPCKHAVASIHDIADHGMDVGLLEAWVHPAYKLETLVTSGKIGRKGLQVTCSSCKGKGHNKRGCKANASNQQPSQGNATEVDASGSQPQPSQGNASQGFVGSPSA
ncbi:mutator type transposase [Tanacetum coccineum]